MKPTLEFLRISEKAIPPRKQSSLSAGYDICSAYELVIPPKEKAVVETDLKIRLPSGCYGRLAPKLGLTINQFIHVGAGVIDQDYRGNVGVVLFNFSDNEFEIKQGDIVAQLICQKIEYPDLVEVNTLDETKRGSGGFGSTGIKNVKVFYINKK